MKLQIDIVSERDVLCGGGVVVGSVASLAE